MVASELFLIYLELVDIPEGVVYTLVSVVNAGGLDTHLAQANINACVPDMHALLPSCTKPKRERSERQGACRENGAH